MIKSLLRVSVCRPPFGLTHLKNDIIRIGKVPTRALQVSSCCCHQKFLNIKNTNNEVFSAHSTLNRGLSSTAVSEGIFSKILGSVGYEGRFEYNRTVMRRAALRLYMCAVELVDYDLFFKELPIEDTFYSWFKITELHIWMCMVRLSAEGKEGLFLRNNMIKNLWEDTEKRMKKLGGVDMKSRREGVEILSEHLRASVFSYDEGLVAGDKELAAAVWRSFFDEQCDDPEKIALVIEYIRKQLHHIEEVNTSILMRTGVVTFLPLKGPEDKQRTKQILLEITRRV